MMLLKKHINTLRLYTQQNIKEKEHLQRVVQHQEHVRRDVESSLCHLEELVS